MTASLIWPALFAGVCLCIHWGSLWLAHSAWARSAPQDARKDRPAISVIRPCCGLEHGLDETLTSTFAADYPDYEILFCVADAADPVIPLINRLIAAHPQIKARLLLGDDKISGNPKLNNCVKGWRAATHDLILLSDSNVILPPDYLNRLMAEWRPGTGLVSSPPVGNRPPGFWARLECAFLNTCQARWQMASARLDNGFAQGKMLLWDKSVLERAGGIAVLGREMAEDVASTKIVRAAGLKVRVPGRFFAQPIGPRRFAGVWGRQLRWARVRRLGFPLLFLPELFIGAAFPTLAILLAFPSLLTLILWLILWFAPEYLLARAADWPRSSTDIAAWLLRDALCPALWVACWAGNSFEWRGTAMSASQTPKTGA
jgi:ceramide glucosyltransferase